jgi:hypothetical protein
MTTITLTLPMGFDGVSAKMLSNLLCDTICAQCQSYLPTEPRSYDGSFGCNGCDARWCDDCWTKGFSCDEEFLCLHCAGKEASFQKCEGEGCPHFRYGDEDCWNCHEYLPGGDKVLCDECESKLTPEQKTACGDAGCDACGDGMAEECCQCHEVLDVFTGRKYYDPVGALCGRCFAYVVPSPCRGSCDECCDAIAEGKTPDPAACEINRPE